MDEDEPAADRLLNWDFVGRCYDILHTDPLDLKKGARDRMAFDMQEFENTPDRKASKPIATDYLAEPGGDFTSRVQEMSSTYDYATTFRNDASLSVGDPAGAAFGASLSSSFETTRQDVETRDSVVTLTGVLVTLFQLTMRDKPGVRKLDADLAAALQALPTAPGSEHQAFFVRFGTHYSQRVLFGGRATQRIVVSSGDYTSLLEDRVDLAAEASATFAVATAKGEVSTGQTQTRKTKRGQSLKVESVVYTGGQAPQQMFDMWSQYVDKAPAPVQANFEPLYELLTAEFFPQDAGLDARRAALKQATNSYLATKGHDTNAALLVFGDEVCLTLNSGGQVRYLAAASGYTRTEPWDDTDAPPRRLRWVLTDAQTPAASDMVNPDRPIALRNAETGAYLDAQAGSDGNYSKGDGLTGTSTTPAVTSTRWTLQLAGSRRKELVDRDVIQLRSAWSDSDGKNGYLLGESNPHDPSQRVFAFGLRTQKGSFWRMTRLK